MINYLKKETEKMDFIERLVAFGLLLPFSIFVWSLLLICILAGMESLWKAVLK